MITQPIFIIRVLILISDIKMSNSSVERKVNNLVSFESLRHKKLFFCMTISRLQSQ